MCIALAIIVALYDASRTTQWDAHTRGHVLANAALTLVVVGVIALAPPMPNKFPFPGDLASQCPGVQR